MTLLESKAVRDERGIDTFERGFVYAALALRASNTNPNNVVSGRANKYFNAVRVIADLTARTGDVVEPVLRVDAKLPYHSQLALLFGGNFVKSIESYGNIDPGMSIKCLPSNPNYLLILEEPAWVNSLERYLAWCAHNLIEGHAALGTNPIPVTSNFFDEDSLEPSLIITAALRFDLLEYLNGNNLISAIKSVIKSANERYPVLSNYSASALSLSIDGTSQSFADIAAASVLFFKNQGESISSLQNQSIVYNSTSAFVLTDYSSFALFDDNVTSFSLELSTIGGSSTYVLTDNNLTVNATNKFFIGERSSAKVTIDIIAVSTLNKLRLQGKSASFQESVNVQGKIYAVSQSSLSLNVTPATYENLNDNNGTTGSATTNQEISWIKATFNAKVLVKSVTVGGGTLANWGSVANFLTFGYIDYSLDDLTWQQVVSIGSVSDTGADQFKTFVLPTATLAQFWRLRRSGRLSTTELRFN